MSGLRAGAARLSIAPRADDLRDGVFLGGFGSYRQRRATGVHDEPLCRAIAIGDGETAFVVAALDLVGASGPLLQSIREQASRLTRLPASRILIACTHSHASPDMQGLWGGTGADYEAHVARQSAGAIKGAFDAMEPAEASVATTSLGGVVRNRLGVERCENGSAHHVLRRCGRVTCRLLGGNGRRPVARASFPRLVHVQPSIARRTQTSRSSG